MKKPVRQRDNINVKSLRGTNTIKALERLPRMLEIKNTRPAGNRSDMFSKAKSWAGRGLAHLK